MSTKEQNANFFTLPVTPSPCVCALGFFDGVHLGHKALFEATLKMARHKGLTPAVFTFSSGLKEENAHLLSFAQRIEEIKKQGIEQVYAVAFDDIKNYTAIDFIKKILIETCGVCVAVCGENFCFGQNREGDAHFLEAIMQCSDKEALIIPQKKVDGVSISTTEIRKALAKGDVALAESMLGHPYTYTGKVGEGKHLGRTLGFPTVNQACEDKLLLTSGVYHTTTEIDGRIYQALTNIGVRPTVDKDKVCNVESHIINFNGMLYGEELTFAFHRFLREEKRFSSLEALIEQIKKDKEQVLNT